LSLRCEEELLIEDLAVAQASAARSLCFDLSSSRLDDGVKVVRFEGELDYSNALEFEQALCRIATDSAARLVVDLTDCAFIDSAGVKALVSTRQAMARDGGGGLAIAARHQQVVRVLRPVGLDELIRVRPSVGEAAEELTQ
jgi:anti-sigma B factor antagonist